MPSLYKKSYMYKIKNKNADENDKIRVSNLNGERQVVERDMYGVGEFLAFPLSHPILVIRLLTKNRRRGIRFSGK